MSTLEIKIGKVINILNKDQNHIIKGLGLLGEVDLNKEKNSNIVLTTINNNIAAFPGITGTDKTKSESRDTTVILEMANFNSISVSQNAAALNYRSNSSKIYSGQIGPCLSSIALIRLGQIIAGKAKISKILKWEKPNEKKDQNKNNSFIVELEYLARKIDNLQAGFDYWKGMFNMVFGILGDWDISTKTFTPNKNYNMIQTQEDLLQEFIRLVDIKTLSNEELTQNIFIKNEGWKNLQKQNSLKNELVKINFSEIFTRPFVEKDDLLENIENTLEIINPYSQLQPFLRGSLIPSLLKCFSNNVAVGVKSPRIFEINKVFSLKNNLATEIDNLCLVFETNDWAVATSIANYISSLLGGGMETQNGQLEFNNEPVAGNLGLVYRFPNLELFQISKKVLKKYNLPPNKIYWGIQAVLDPFLSSFDNKTIYIETGNFNQLTRSISIQAEISGKGWGGIYNLLKSVELGKNQINITLIDIFNIENSLQAVYTAEIEIKSEFENVTGEMFSAWQMGIEKILSENNYILKK